MKLVNYMDTGPRKFVWIHTEIIQTVDSEMSRIGFGQESYQDNGAEWSQI